MALKEKGSFESLGNKANQGMLLMKVGKMELPYA